MKKILMVAAPVAAFCILGALIGATATKPTDKPADEYRLLGEVGLNCDTEVMMFAQIMLLQSNDPARRVYTYPECRYSGGNLIVKVLERPIAGLTARVNLEGKEVWVMRISLKERAEQRRVAPPKYEQIPAPGISTMQTGKQYL